MVMQKQLFVVLVRILNIHTVRVLRIFFDHLIQLKGHHCVFQLWLELIVLFDDIIYLIHFY